MASRRLLSTRTVILGSGPAATSAAVLSAVRTSRQGQVRGMDVGLTLVGTTGVQPFEWSKVMKQLRIGQSFDALNLAGTKQFPGVAWATAGELAHSERVHKQAALDLSQGMEINGKVTKVVKYGRNEIVTTVQPIGGPPIEILAQEVIAAFGAGPERHVAAPVKRRFGNLIRPFGERLVGSQGVSTGVEIQPGSVILIIGDGPTALWDAEVCLSYGAIPYVVGPNNGGAFLGADPGGRNSETMRTLRENNLLFIADIEGIEELDNLKYFDDMREAGILVYLKNLTSLSTGSYRSASVLPVARVISAIGSMGPSLSMFDHHILEDMGPMVVEGVEGRAAVALATKEYDILGVGAMAQSHGLTLNLKTLFNAPGDRIGQPPPGIIATRGALREAMREKARVKLGAKMEDVPYIQSLFMMDKYDAMSATHAETSQALQVCLLVPKRDADEMVKEILEKRREFIIANREFTNLEFVAQLREMGLKVPEKSE
jgi:hypothetical protein